MTDQEPHSHRPPSRLRTLVGQLVPAGGDDADDTATEAPVQTRDRWPRWFGIGVILVIFGGLGGWAATATIDSAVIADGTVTVDSYRQNVQHLEGGIVERIHVRDGDVVERGDVLITLDDTHARAEYLMGWSRYLSELARQARLRAEMEGAESIDFPEEVRESAEDSERTEQVVATQRREFEARREALDGEIELLEQRTEQLRERVAGMEAQREATLETIGSLEDELESKRRLVEQEAMPEAELRPVERELADARGEAGELRAEIAATRVEIGETQQQILQRQREFQSEVASELRETNDRVDELEEELRSLEDTLARKQIRAPASGEVVDLDVHTERAVIQGGEPILGIVPEDEPLVVEARVRPQDIDNVYVGLDSTVRFTAFSRRRTPVIEGQVTFVSADRLEDEQDGEPYYLARVVVGQEELAKLGEGVELKAGMPADVMIQTGEMTPAQYIIKPLTDAIARSFRED